MEKITAENFLDIVDNESSRDALLSGMASESGTGLLLRNLVADLGFSCQAEAGRLDAVIRRLVERGPACAKLVRVLSLHGNVPDKTLFFLFDRELCLDELGHRRKPQKLLEFMAEKYRYSEAITTLALDYYGSSDYSPEEFGAFVREYASDYMLRANLERATNLAPRKQDIIREVLGSQQV